MYSFSYNEKFYKTLLANPSELSRLAFCGDVVVGGVCSRIDVDEHTKKTSLYIMTLGCLAAYRRQGVGK